MTASLLPLVTKRRVLLAASILCWGLAVCSGLIVMSNYANRPGVGATPPTRWPSASRIERPEGLATLVMLVHPRCPCSRASIEELDRLMVRSRGLVATRVLFLKPSDVSEDWEKTDLWRSAAAIPGVEVMRDDDGVEAARFGAATSGQVILYDRDGRLLFSGGITASRGHAGDNDGRDAIVSLLGGGRGTRHSSPVFGCSLLEPASSVNRTVNDAF